MSPRKTDPETAVAETAIAVIICAAGASTRMGGLKKEYCSLPAHTDITVLCAAVKAFVDVPQINNIVITIPDDPVNGIDAAQKALSPVLAEKDYASMIHFVSGGATRQASVFNALSFLAANKGIRYVLIHDGARPFVSSGLIMRVIAAVQKHGAVIPLLPLTETPKETDLPLNALSDARPGFIRQHLKRAVVGAAQTPQGFAFPAILDAHQKAAAQESGVEFTDDAEVWASFCGPVAAIPGENENRKITFPEDLC